MKDILLIIQTRFINAKYFFKKINTLTLSVVSAAAICAPDAFCDAPSEQTAASIATARLSVTETATVTATSSAAAIAVVVTADAQATATAIARVAVQVTATLNAAAADVTATSKTAPLKLHSPELDLPA